MSVVKNMIDNNCLIMKAKRFTYQWVFDIHYGI